MSSFKYKGKRVLLTEGKNDCHVIASLCAQHQVPENFGLYNCESDNQALKRLSALIAGSETVETIGIVQKLSFIHFWHGKMNRECRLVKR